MCILCIERAYEYLRREDNMSMIMRFSVVSNYCTNGLYYNAFFADVGLHEYLRREDNMSMIMRFSVVSNYCTNGLYYDAFFADVGLPRRMYINYIQKMVRLNNKKLDKNIVLSKQFHYLLPLFHEKLAKLNYIK
jgi:hypothetical protein